MKLTRDGITYIHGATHAGLDCWLSERFVQGREVGCWVGTGRELPPGDFAKDELIRYLADPDGYNPPPLSPSDPTPVVHITGEKRESWPLKSPVYMLRPSTPVKFVSQDEGAKFTKTDNGVKIEFNPTPDQERVFERLMNADDQVVLVKAGDVSDVVKMRGEFTTYETALAAAPKNTSRIIKWEDGSYSVEVEKAGDGKGSGQTPMDTAAPDQPDSVEDQYEPVGTFPVVGDWVTSAGPGDCYETPVEVVKQEGPTWLVPCRVDGYPEGHLDRVHKCNFTRGGWRVLKRKPKTSKT